MAGVAVLTYHVLELVDAEHGHWCPQCALPSASKITLASQIKVGHVLGALRLSTRLRCDDGHGWFGPAL